MKRYSIVSYVEGEAGKKVRDLQEELVKRTGSRKCIDAWMPHITLGSGIFVPETEQEKLEQLFSSVAANHTPLDIDLRGFGGTETWGGASEGKLTPYVLWIEPIKTAQLQELFDDIKEKITDGYDTFYPRIISYAPHVTVAYGDLTKEGYDIGNSYLAAHSFEGVMRVDHIALVENFDDKDVEYKRFYLKD